MVGLVFPEHVINKVGRECHLLARFAFARMLALDQSANHRDLAERTFQQVAALHPIDELISQNVRREQRRWIGNRFQTPYAERIIARDKAHRHQPAAFHSPGEQHAQRLVRVPAFERIGHHIMPFVVRKCFDQQLPGGRHLASVCLHLQPFAHLVGKARPARTIDQHVPHPVGQMRRQRQSCAHVARDVCGLFLGGANDEIEVLDLFDLQRHSCKSKSITGT